MRKLRKEFVSRPFFRLFIPITIILLPLLLLGGSVSNASAPLPQTQKPSSSLQTLVLRVYFHDNAERDRLASQFDAEEMPTTGGFLTVFADQAEYSSMLAQGLRVEVDEEGTKEINNANVQWRDPNANPDTFDGGYRTDDEIQTFINTEAANHPTLATVVDIGDSWCKQHAPCTISNPSLTWNGYDLYAIHITNQAIAGPKPVYWYDAGIHAREIAVPEIAMRYISYLLDGYDSDPDAHWLVDYNDIWVVPILNPDGHFMDESGGSNPGAVGQRKNGNYTNGCTTWHNSGSQLGTDNNRNFPFLWNCCGGSSSAPCAQDYHGPSANSDPETQAVVNEIRTLVPDQRGPNIGDAAPITATGMYQNMHSNASLDLYPWGMYTTAAPNGTDLGNIARHMSAANAYPPGNSYQACQPPLCLYSVDGDAFDWAYGELGMAGVTTEIGGSSFYPTYSTIDSSLWPANRGALIYEAKVARTPYLTTRGPDASGVASTPMTVTQGSPSTLAGTINYNWTGNSYLQNVADAEYYIDTPPWAGGTPIPMTGTYNSSTVPVQATVDTSGLSVGRHILFVQGRGVNDYSGLHSWGPVTAAWLWVTTPNGSPTATFTPGPPATPSFTATPTRTNTATITPTRTPSQPPSSTVPPTSTGEPTRTLTNTPTSSSTNTPTQTNTPLPTQTPGGPSATPVPTNTNTNTPTDTNTPLPTQTPGGPSATPIPTDTTAPSSTPGVPTITPTPCTLSFIDIPPGSTFYPYIHCLACLGIINGYPDGTFRFNNPVTRGQLSKIVSNSAGFSEPETTQMFQDVPPTGPGSTFFVYINRLASRGYINGYPCGGPGEPCMPPNNLPYFRPNNNASRGQISKIVSNAAGFADPPSGLQFQDVLPGSTYYTYTYRLATRGVMSGYPCGQLGEPCIPPDNLPYFRPNANATRGQTSKIDANTFFPDCETPEGR